jgi:hypothetical protein
MDIGERTNGSDLSVSRTGDHCTAVRSLSKMVNYPGNPGYNKVFSFLGLVRTTAPSCRAPCHGIARFAITRPENESSA